MAEDVQRRAIRLLELRQQAEAGREARVNTDVHDVSSEPSIFYALKGDTIEEIEIFLDERLIDMLNRYEEPAWQGVIEFIEDDLSHREAS
jgi:hypothetical protein